jgi:hypothetical protein
MSGRLSSRSALRRSACARSLRATARRSRNGAPSRLTRMALLREAAASVVERGRPVAEGVEMIEDIGR